VAEGRFQKAVACWRDGRPAEAESLCTALLRDSPGHLDAHRLLAQILASSSRIAGAIAIRRRVADLAPRDDLNLLHLASLLQLSGEHAAACALLDRVIERQPGCAAAHAARALALVGLNRDGDVLDAVQRALGLDPRGTNPIVLQTGYQLLRVGRIGTAYETFSRLLEAQPADMRVQQARVITLIGMSRYEEALPALAALQASGQPIDYLPGIVLHAKLQCCDWTDIAAARAAITAAVRRAERADVPLAFMVHNDSPADQRRCAEIYVADKCRTGQTGPAGPGPRALRRPEAAAAGRIRLAYLSADFRDHAVGQLLAGVLARHDRSRFETFAFSTGYDDGSELRRRIERSFEHFVDAAAWSDRTLAERIAAAGIDILVDLGGHSMGGRTSALADKPAPIQVGFLGFPGTSGARFIDYLIADRHVLPPRDRAHYTEQVIYMPHTYLPTDGAPAVAAGAGAGAGAQRTAAGLPANGFVFCCFNGAHKLSPEIFALWMRLLAAQPQSILWLRAVADVAKRNLAREAAKHGVDPDRILFAARTATRTEHYARFALADLFLDTHPFNAHTTASEALGVGVPVLTLRGASFASRVATSLLEACGLGRLAVETPEDYERLALRLARSPRELADLKAVLQAGRSTVPLFDTAGYCRHLESAYEQIWARRLRGEAAATLWVEA